MLELIKVSAFKSLVDFELKLTKFNCIIGLNGSGKSTVLQLISYISSIFQGNTQQWLEDRDWTNSEVVSQFKPTRKTIDITLEFNFGDNKYLWIGTYNWDNGICTKESLFNNSHETELVYRVYNNQYKSIHGALININFNYQGSILSILNDEVIPHDAKRIKEYMENIESHDLLSPKVMRSGQYSRQGKLGSSGQFLIDHIHRLSDRERDLTRDNLAIYFPQVFKLETKTQLNGTLSMSISERFYNEDGSHIDITTDARHINDGMLRMLNILANQRSTARFQLFDEIENGVNPEVTEKLMDSFTSSPQQTLVTTHSPMVLNYLDEDLAVESIIFVYKQKNGMTRAKHLFEIPLAKAKLDELAPGEVMVDLYLEEVASEAEAIEKLN